MRGLVYSDDARFNGHMVDVAPTVGGRVVDMRVKEGDTVCKGQLLFDLDPSVQRTVVAQNESAVEAARAGLAVAKARYERAKNGPQPRKSGPRRRLRQGCVTKTPWRRPNWTGCRDYARKEPELRTNWIVRRRRMKAPDKATKAPRKSLILLRQGTRTDDLEVASAEAKLAQGRVAEAQAALAKANADLDCYSVHARMDGHVVRRWVDPGAVVQTGQPVISVYDPATLRVDANIEEKYLDDVALGTKWKSAWTRIRACGSKAG